MPKVAIHCKASVSDGMGHIYRQVNLANELSKQGWEISFHIPHFEPAINLLIKFGFTPVLTNRITSTSEDSNKYFDLAILDLQNTTESLIYSIKKFVPRIVSFEDLGSGRNHADILIDCNLAPSESKKLASNTRALFGPDYSALHPDFAYYNLRPRKFNSSFESALITMGATDPQELTLSLTQLILNEKKNLKLTVLTGHKAVNSSQFDELASKFKSLNLSGPVSNMAKTLWEHEVVVCSGGITLHEAVAVGTPAFVINQVEHQQVKARFVEKSGAAINLGLGNQYKKEKLRETLTWGKPALESMSVKGKKLIDGRGIFRVAEAITKLLKDQ